MLSTRESQRFRFEVLSNLRTLRAIETVNENRLFLPDGAINWTQLQEGQNRAIGLIRDKAAQKVPGF